MVWPYMLTQIWEKFGGYMSVRRKVEKLSLPAGWTGFDWIGLFTGKKYPASLDELHINVLRCSPRLFQSDFGNGLRYEIRNKEITNVK